MGVIEMDSTDREEGLIALWKGSERLSLPVFTTGVSRVIGPFPPLDHQPVNGSFNPLRLEQWDNCWMFMGGGGEVNIVFEDNSC